MNKLIGNMGKILLLYEQSNIVYITIILAFILFLDVKIKSQILSINSVGRLVNKSNKYEPTKFSNPTPLRFKFKHNSGKYFCDNALK